MRKTLLFTLFAVCTANGQVLIDDTQNSNESPDPKAILELRSTSKGLLLPRLSTSTIEGMQNPQAGMMVFDKQKKVFKGYNGTEWVVLPSGGNDNSTQNAPTASDVNFTGNLTVEQELQGIYNYNGDTEGNSTFIWNSASDNTGSDKAQIATTQNYTLVANDLNKYIQFCVTPVDNTSSSGEEQCSTWKGAIKDRVTPPQVGNVLLEDNFNGLGGNDNTSRGANRKWNGNDNFPTINRAYQAGNAIKIGAGDSSGSITSKQLNFNNQNITVTLNIKGWSEIEGYIIVTINGDSQDIKYNNTRSDDYESKSVTFYNVPDNGKVEIATSEKRVYIDKVIITRD
ncbi:hypothetical protein KRX57_09460 [Weeksellaceae bacterium TAE3-ERU29]|nr:hypothetical protein [Weeksellaceae bacterium TAE3-ERU29]